MGSRPFLTTVPIDELVGALLRSSFLTRRTTVAANRVILASIFLVLGALMIITAAANAFNVDRQPTVLLVLIAALGIAMLVGGFRVWRRR